MLKNYPNFYLHAWIYRLLNKKGKQFFLSLFNVLPYNAYYDSIC